MAETCLIIPAYNEAPVIRDVLNELMPLGYQIIVVDDASTDGTSAMVSSFPVILLRHRINLGQGAALETGMEAARRIGADYIVHFDADGQHDPADIGRLVSLLRTGKTDIIFGSRFLGTKAIGLTAIKRATLQVARWFNYGLTGVLLTDAHNGLRAMNKKALHAIRLRQAGMAHATEILYEVKKNALRYQEFPVQIRYTNYSKQKGQGILNGINILFHLIFKKN